MTINFMLVGLGGFFGSIARFSLARLLNGHIIGTWIANITGSILLAFTLHFYINESITTTLYLLIGVGFSGAYTTFSTFGHETVSFIIEKKYITAVIYVLASFCVAIGSVALIFYWVG